MKFKMGDFPVDLWLQDMGFFYGEYFGVATLTIPETIAQMNLTFSILQKGSRNDFTVEGGTEDGRTQLEARFTCKEGNTFSMARLKQAGEPTIHFRWKVEDGKPQVTYSSSD